MAKSDSKSVGGRPKKDDAQKFTERFQTRLTPSQATAFRARARRRGLSATRLMRKLMTGVIVDVQGIVIAYEDIASLRKSCGRLSVIEDRLGRGGGQESDPEMKDIQRELHAEIEALRDLIQRLEEGDDRA